MYWTIVGRETCEIGETVACILRRRYGSLLGGLDPEVVNGDEFRGYLKGLRDAGVEGAHGLSKALRDHQIKIHA